MELEFAKLVLATGTPFPTSQLESTLSSWTAFQKGLATGTFTSWIRKLRWARYQLPVNGIRRVRGNRVKAISTVPVDHRSLLPVASLPGTR
jgi:hypothetical protein